MIAGLTSLALLTPTVAYRAKKASLLGANRVYVPSSENKEDSNVPFASIGYVSRR